MESNLQMEFVPAPSVQIPPTSDCVAAADEYTLTPVVDCFDQGFACPEDHAFFADACGCGCAVLTFPESSPARVSIDEGPLVDLPQECNGPTGPLALPSAEVVDMVLSDDHVYVVTGPPDEASWAIEKRTGAISLITDGVDPLFSDPTPDSTVTTGGMVNRGYELLDAGDGFRYENDSGLERTPIGGGKGEKLFDTLNAQAAFIVHDTAFYGVNAEGQLVFGRVWPEPSAPVPIEQRGSFDDDDYPALVGIDEDAVYWFAGSDPRLRTSDGDPYALYRSCRIDR